MDELAVEVALGMPVGVVAHSTVEVLRLLGMAGVYSGLNLVITRGLAITGIPDSIGFLGKGVYLGTPMPFIIMLALLAVITAIMGKTPFGRYIYAIGNSTPAAKMLGIPVNRIKVISFMISTFLAGIAGSLYLLIGLAFVFVFSSLGLGLIISTIAKTQLQAMLGSFMIMLPSILLSGFIFPIESMPAWIRPITYVIPLRYYLVIVRGIFLKGVGLETLWPQALALLAWGLTILALAHFGIPVSTTHTITGAIVGVGSTRGTRAVRWGVAGRIVWAWILTIPAAAIVAAAVYLLTHLVLRHLGVVV